MSSYALMIAVIVAVVFICLPYNCNALASHNKKPILRRFRSAFSLKPWFEDGLNFNCTGCGKCCKVDGDVWLAPEEVDSIMSHLGYSSVDDFRNEVRYFACDVYTKYHTLIEWYDHLLREHEMCFCISTLMSGMLLSLTYNISPFHPNSI